jgi:hypothetical protein
MVTGMAELLARSASLSPSAQMLVSGILRLALELAQGTSSELEQGFEFPWRHQLPYRPGVSLGL